MNVYDSLITKTIDILNKCEVKSLPVHANPDWPILKSAEFLLGKEVAFELGDRFKPCVVYNCPTSNKELVGEDKILLIGKDLSCIKENTNFSRLAFFNIDEIKDANKAYIGVKRLDYERYKIIPEGYMILSSSFDNKENVRVSKKAIKNGLNFETLGNIYIDHYKKLSGVNNVVIIFIVGDFPYIDELLSISHDVTDVTNAFDHILKDIIVDCEVCPLKKICEQIEELRLLHFDETNKRKNTKK